MAHPFLKTHASSHFVTYRLSLCTQHVSRTHSLQHYTTSLHSYQQTLHLDIHLTIHPPLHGHSRVAHFTTDAQVDVFQHGDTANLALPGWHAHTSTTPFCISQMSVATSCCLWGLSHPIISQVGYYAQPVIRACKFYLPSPPASPSPLSYCPWEQAMLRTRCQSTCSFPVTKQAAQAPGAAGSSPGRGDIST